MNTYRITFQSNSSVRTVKAANYTEAVRKVFGAVGAARLGKMASCVLVTDAEYDRNLAITAWILLHG